MNGGMLTMTGLLAADCIQLHAQAAEREQALLQLGALLEAEYGLPAAGVAAKLWARERRKSTALGYGIALPHADMPALNRPVAAYLRLADGIDFGAPDQQPVHHLLALVVPRPAGAAHFEMLTHYRHLLVSRGFRTRLAACADAGAAWRLFDEHEWRSGRAG